MLFIREGGQEMVLDSKKALRSNVRQDFQGRGCAQRYAARRIET